MSQFEDNLSMKIESLEELKEVVKTIEEISKDTFNKNGN
jgi:hypothetical protein